MELPGSTGPTRPLLELRATCPRPASATRRTPRGQTPQTPLRATTRVAGRERWPEADAAIGSSPRPSRPRLNAASRSGALTSYVVPGASDSARLWRAQLAWIADLEWQASLLRLFRFPPSGRRGGAVHVAWSPRPESARPCHRRARDRRRQSSSGEDLAAARRSNGRGASPPKPVFLAHSHRHARIFR